MVETGKRLELDERTVADKHSLGGIPGDKTSMLVVPIIASLGLKIPKTSSRAITDPAGTADRVEVLMPVSLGLDKMKKVVEATNGCLVWGGSLGLAPADDLIINIERPLSIDPFLLPSIMAKKYAVGATHVVLDLPVGPEAKLKDLEEAKKRFKQFWEIGKELKIKLDCVVTNAYQPLGTTVGPAIEAKEVLEVLMREKEVKDLEEKALTISAAILRLTKVVKSFKKAYKTAKEVLETGDAEKKFREIIHAQGGNPRIKPEKIKLGNVRIPYKAEKEGYVSVIHNSKIVRIGRIAGAPFDKGAGLKLYKKLGDYVEKGDVLFEVFTTKPKVKDVIKFLRMFEVYEISDKKPKLKPTVLKILRRSRWRKLF